MTTTQRVQSAPGDLRAGDVVRVRSREEILATLDADGRIDGLQFMPEMLSFAGQQIPVSKIAHKTCDTVDWTGIRKLDRTVHLGDTRCDGSAHGGCQANCLLFWREEWLERPDGTPLQEDPSQAGSATEETLREDSTAGTDTDGATLYRCQATELVRASRPLPRFEMGQYVADVRTGNWRLFSVLRGLSILLFNRVQELSRKLPARLRIAEGRAFPFYWGTGPAPKGSLQGFQPGDLVEVRSKEEIMATLGPDNKTRGLWFDAEMLTYCGRRGRVLKSIEKIIEEPTGRMIHLRDCYMIEQFTCIGDLHRFCPRAIYAYWRESWLRKVDEPDASSAR